MQRPPDLDGKVCVVTGGGRGIGYSIARAFAREGGRVVVVDRDPELAEDSRTRLAEDGAEAHAYPLDVTDEAAVVAMAERVHAELGSVDVLVNNAGISRLGPSMSFSLQDWNDSFAVLTTGVFLCSREFGKALRASGGGTIVNISSINGVVAFPMRLAYSAAKAAVVSMTKVLAVEWAGYGIRVNCVAPGMTRTEMLQEAIDQGFIPVDTYMDHLPLRRFGEPDEIAEAVLYFASPRSSYCTGQVVVPDGGWSSFSWIPWSNDPEAPGVLDGEGGR